LSVPQDQVHLVVDQPDFHLARGGLLRVRVRGRLRIQFVDLGGDHVRVDPEFAQRPGRHAVLRPQHRLKQVMAADRCATGQRAGDGHGVLGGRCAGRPWAGRDVLRSLR
jgi:hypothetical protein